ncbi:MAG: IS30 family transposase, partial [Patescibacteria group bacterium]|nr:IS30 family transposase [Patescibacteria group bacterium]
MSEYLVRDHSCIVREINRNKDPDGIYRAESAQRKTDLRKRKKHKKKLETDEDLKLYTIKKLQEGLSPEQIA